MNANWRKNGLVYILIVVAVAVLFYSASQSAERPPEKGLTDVAALIRSGEVSRIVVDGDKLSVQLNEKSLFVSNKEDGVNLTTSLARLGVTRKPKNRGGRRQYETIPPRHSATGRGADSAVAGAGRRPGPDRVPRLSGC